jgi:hypothetical protein
MTYDVALKLFHIVWVTLISSDIIIIIIIIFIGLHWISLTVLKDNITAVDWNLIVLKDRRSKWGDGFVCFLQMKTALASQPRTPEPHMRK